ncbi:MAG: hypothetical protein ACE5JG_10965 [Planctomycetota bacterium]
MPVVVNSILWANEPDQVAGAGNVSFSCVQGGYPGPGNIEADPLFADPSAGDYRLGPGSACINLGSNALLPPDSADLDGDGTVGEPVPFDLALAARVANGTVDAGAYERCLGQFDLDGNGVIGIGDLLLLLGLWGSDPGGPPDFDGSGAVGVGDLLLLLANWGPCG